MQDTNAPVLRPAPASAKEDVISASHLSKPRTENPVSFVSDPYPQSLLQRLLVYIKSLFSMSKPALKPLPVKTPVSAAQASASIESQPIAFKGGTAMTLATPMGAYAGKPAQQRMRKLAEQQFHQMDVSQTTMN